MITAKHVRRRVVIVSGIYRGVVGTLSHFMANFNGTDYAEVDVRGDSRYIVPAARVELCDDSDTERGVVDEELRNEQKKRGLR